MHPPNFQRMRRAFGVKTRGAFPQRWRPMFSPPAPAKSRRETPADDQAAAESRSRGAPDFIEAPVLDDDPALVPRIAAIIYSEGGLRSRFHGQKVQ
jgi:hypothetical protein